MEKYYGNTKFSVLVQTLSTKMFFDFPTPQKYALFLALSKHYFWCLLGDEHKLYRWQSKPSAVPCLSCRYLKQPEVKQAWYQSRFSPHPLFIRGDLE